MSQSQRTALHNIPILQHKLLTFSYSQHLHDKTQGQRWPTDSSDGPKVKRIFSSRNDTIHYDTCDYTICTSLWCVHLSVWASGESVYRNTEPISDIFKYRHRYRRRYFKYRNTDKWIPKIPKIRFCIHLLELWAMLPLKLDNLISLTDIWSWRVLHPNCECVFAGVFNVNWDGSD